MLFPTVQPSRSSRECPRLSRHRVRNRHPSGDRPPPLGSERYEGPFVDHLLGGFRGIVGTDVEMRYARCYIRWSIAHSENACSDMTGFLIRGQGKTFAFTRPENSLTVRNGGIDRFAAGGKLLVLSDQSACDGFMAKSEHGLQRIGIMPVRFQCRGHRPDIGSKAYNPFRGQVSKDMVKVSHEISSPNQDCPKATNGCYNEIYMGQDITSISPPRTIERMNADLICYRHSRIIMQCRLRFGIPETVSKIPNSQVSMRSDFPSRKSIMFRWIIPSRDMSSLSSDITNLGEPSRMGAKAPNSRSIVLSSASR